MVDVNAKPMVTSKEALEQVEVSLFFDAVPDVGRHRVELSDGDGAVCWFSAGIVPVTLQFTQGETLFATASVAARREASSKTRPSKHWQLQVQRGQTAILKLGTRDGFRPQDRLELRVEGARLSRKRT
jgi:hypothetical protein